jgi:V/A-type H+-transporting ATPase subunit D
VIAMPDLRVPPGRAGRLWLRHRLAVAERGVALLEQKLRLLRAELDRLRARLERTEQLWAARATEADTWGLRAGVAGGRRAFRLAQPGELAEVHVHWTAIMGVHYPDQVDVVPPDEHADDLIVGNAALLRARKAYRLALEAAARHAATNAAAEIVDAEVITTRQRQRALRRHWIPRLRRALDDVELALEEQERAEAVRRRWAARADARH